MRALRALVEREEQAGKIEAARCGPSGRASLAPGDESWLRRAMSLLDRTGDTGGALRLHEAYARRLRAEFNAVPSAETESLAARDQGRGGFNGRHRAVCDCQLIAIGHQPSAISHQPEAPSPPPPHRPHRCRHRRRCGRHRARRARDERHSLRGRGRPAAGARRGLRQPHRRRWAPVPRSHGPGLDRAGPPPHRAGGRGRPARGVRADAISWAAGPPSRPRSRDIPARPCSCRAAISARATRSSSTRRSPTREPDASPASWARSSRARATRSQGSTSCGRG